MDSTFHMAYRDDASLFMHNVNDVPSWPADVDFPEISSVRSIGSSDSGRVLVVRTELRQLRQRQLRSPVLFTHKLTSAALGSGVACYRPSNT